MKANEKRKALIKHFGSKCQYCGYQVSINALTFRFANNNQRRSDLLRDHSLETLKKELQSAVILCLNCDARVSSGELFLDYNFTRNRIVSISEVVEEVTTKYKNPVVISETAELEVVTSTPTELRHARQPIPRIRA